MGKKQSKEERRSQYRKAFDSGPTKSSKGKKKMGSRKGK